MKVGDYVRTKSYGIKKINGFSSTLEEDFIDCDYDKYQKVLINKKEVIKSSPNIIDLIEVGDYVNGKKVIDTFTDYIFDYSEEFKAIRFSETDILHNVKHIKSIVTKEQFESMEYKVGE